MKRELVTASYTPVIKESYEGEPYISVELHEPLGELENGDISLHLEPGTSIQEAHRIARELGRLIPRVGWLVKR